jgi:hypothetical protein
MANSIVELINSQMPTVQTTVDLTLSRTSSTGAQIIDGNPDPALDMFFPIVSYQDSQIALLKFRNYKPTIASVVATDGEIPNDRDRLTITQEMLGNLKLAKGRIFTEEDFDLARRAEMLANSGQSAAAEAIRDNFLAVPGLLGRSVVNLHTVLSLRVAVAGQCLFTDTTTGIPALLDYTTQIPSGHLADTLTGNNRWSQSATATGVQNIVDHMTAVYASIKRFPPYIVMGLTEAINLRNQAATKEVVARMKGMITELGTVDAAALAAMPAPSLEEIGMAVSNRLLGSGGTPGTVQIIISDAIYYERGSGVNGTVEKSYIPAGYYFFAWPNYIERALVPSAVNDFAGAGLVTTTDIVSKDPRQEKVAVSARGLPLVPDPRLIAARNVENNVIS